MKSTTSSFFTFKPILISLFLAGFYFISPVNTSAQTGKINNDFFAVPDGPYVAPDIAIARLEEQLIPLKLQLGFYNPSSQEYKTALAKWSFFDRINQRIVEGNSVKGAIQEGVNDFGSSEMSTPLAKGKKDEYKEEVIELLKL